MQITQTDLRSVRITRGPLSLLLRYSLYQDGEERLPESINCSGDTAVAYFLTSTIRDFFTETAGGFTIERSWKIVPRGSFAVSFCLDFEGVPVPYLFPGQAAGEAPPRAGLRVLGDRTAYPNALYLFLRPHALLLFTDGGTSPGQWASLELRPLVIEEEPVMRAELRFPSGEEPLSAPARPSLPGRRRMRGRRQSQAAFSASFQSEGNFEHQLRLHLVAAPPREIYRLGLDAVLTRLPAGTGMPRLPEISALRERIEEGLQVCRSELLVEERAVCGLLAQADSDSLSSLASCTLSMLLLEVHPKNRELTELAQRLADFALRGQHPMGFLYDTFQRSPERWMSAPPLNGVGQETPLGAAARARPQTRLRRAPAGPPPSLESSARIACLMLQAGTLLRNRGLPSARYLQAATRLADVLLPAVRHPPDSEEGLWTEMLGLAAPAARPPGLPAAGLLSPALLELYLRLQRSTGRDPYRKAAAAIRARFLAAPEGGAPLPGPEMEGSLRSAHIALLLADGGPHPKDAGKHLDALLPWIHLNPALPVAGFDPTGGVIERLAEGRLYFRGFEMAYLLLGLDRLIPGGKPLPRLAGLIERLLHFSLQQPPGVPSVALQSSGRPSFAALDSYALVRELSFALRLKEEFPRLFPRAARRARRG
jgi:hypothetical protein